MRYTSAKDWRNAPQKQIMLFGMSGLGKTHISNMLRAAGGWFHYSVDYRIGTRYMGEHIVDNFKKQAMKTPFLANLLRGDSIYIASNITFNNLAPLSTYLGKPGSPDQDGIPFGEYLTRQRQHRQAEINAMLDTDHFSTRAKTLYNYDNFICDTSGSLIEVVDPHDPHDPVLSQVSQTMLPVWIKGDESHIATLVDRFSSDPKPMYYREAFLTRCWVEYLALKTIDEAEVDPDAFIRWGYERLLEDRLPRYQAMADNWGVTVQANDVAAVTTQSGFITLIADALGKTDR